MPSSVVIDASVAAKWFLRDAAEIDTDLAEEVLLGILTGEVDAHGPGLFRTEVCSLFAKAIGSKRLTLADAIYCVTALFEVPITVHEETEDDLRRAIELAAEHSKSFFDMTYIRLAIELGCRWCTADDRFLRSLPTKLEAQVEALADLRS